MPNEQESGTQRQESPQQYVLAFNTGSVPARTSHTSISRSSATDANTDEPSADSGLNETSPTQPAHIQQQSHVGVLKLLCIYKYIKAECVRALKGLALPRASHAGEIALAG